MSIEPPPRIGPPPLLGAAQSEFKAPVKDVEPEPASRPYTSAQAVPRLIRDDDSKPVKKKFTLLTFFLIILMFGSGAAYFYQDRIVTYYENSGLLQAPAVSTDAGQVEASTPTEEPIVDAPASTIARVPIAEGISEETILANMGTAGMKINYTNDPTYNCGLIGADVAKISLYAAGCYTENYKKTITIYYGSDTDYAMRYFVLLHEYGHYQQGLEGILDSPHYVVSEAEADADCRSLNMGAVTDQVHCTIAGWTPTWLKTKYGIS